MMIYVAGRRLTDSEAFIRLSAYPKATPSNYDLPPCAPGPVTPLEVRRTRAVNSRISQQESRWFQARSQTWDWARIPGDASLGDADPEVPDSLYDEASRMYGHFWSDRPRNVNVAKISKVLHLKYPSLVPILDSHLLSLYRPQARQAAKSSRRWSSRVRHLYWEAVRRDLLRSDLAPVRRMLLADPSTAVLAELTDLRLLDALAW